MHINMQIRNVKRTTPETDLYAKFVVLWYLHDSWMVKECKLL